MPTQPPIIHAFVSSTWHDLQPERKMVEATLQRMRETKFIGMEYFGSRDESTQQTSLEEVDRSQVYIGIFGGRYGSGITEAEYRRAREKDIPCLIYFKDETNIPVREQEKDLGKNLRLLALKEELQKSHTITVFSSFDDLRAKVTLDLHNWLFDEYLVPHLERAVQQGNQAEFCRLTDATHDKETLHKSLIQRDSPVDRDIINSLLLPRDHAPINFVVQGITSLPTDYAARIKNFLTEYLGTPEHPVPFGGRKRDFRSLDTWLDTPNTPPYLLLAAPAGHGKSALLARWSQQLLMRADVAVVFLPVSIRFNTNLPSVVFVALTARLAALHGEKISTSLDAPPEIWRGLMTEYLSRPLPDRRRLLLILDGIDEAAEWEPGPDLFPLSPPPRAPYYHLCSL